MEYIKPMKEMKPKERLQYIWDYYHIPIICVIIGIVVVFSFVSSFLNRKEHPVEVLMINSTISDEIETSIKEQMDIFLVENGYSLKKNEIWVNQTFQADPSRESLSYQELSAINVMMASGTYSVFFGDKDIYEYYLQSDSFLDMTPYLDDTLKERYEDQLVFYTSEETNETYICAIRLDKENAFISNTGCYEECYLCLIPTDANKEVIKEYLHFILK